MSEKITFSDKLRDRGFVDQWGFIIFAFVGFAAIILAKMYSVSAHWVAVGACATMIAYSILVGRSGTGRLRADQAGDNCYYLGLIYTLSSLSYAIFTFDPDNTATTIVQGFGIALVTTILGLVLRVFFNQGRPDLENIEQQVRLEFMEATSQLKSELTSVVQNMNDMSRQLGLSIQEMHSAARTAIEGFALQTTSNVLSVTTAATEAIESQSKDFNVRSKAQLQAVDALVSRLDQHGNSLDGFTEALTAISQVARQASEAVAASSASVSALSQSISVSQSYAQTSSDAASAAATKLAADIQKLEVGMNRIHAEFARQLGELRTGSATATAGAMHTIESASASLAARMEATSRIYEGLSRQAELALTAATNHSDSLEKELSRSREVFARVHSSFAEMTGSIAKFVERNG